MGWMLLLHFSHTQQCMILVLCILIHAQALECKVVLLCFWEMIAPVLNVLGQMITIVVFLVIKMPFGIATPNYWLVSICSSLSLMQKVLKVEIILLALKKLNCQDIT